MNEEVGLDEGDQRIFLVDVTSREDRKVNGRLYCGFCRGYYDVSWHPDSPQLGLEKELVTQHFRDCRTRGEVNCFDLALFDGPGGAKSSAHIRV
jgi:hypothetical protein